MNEQVPTEVIKPSKKSDLWERIGGNLVRYRSSGTYYVVAKLCGQRVRESLRTDNLQEARTKLAQWLATHRTSGSGAGTGAIMGAIMEIWQRDVEEDQTIAPRTKEYKLELKDFLLRQWPGFCQTKARKIRIFDIEQWRNKQKGSAVRTNGTLTILREMFELAEARGMLRGVSPLRGVKNLKVKIASFSLPTKEQMMAIRKDIYERSQNAGVMFDLLRLSGARLETIQHLRWEHIIWDTNRVKYIKAKRGGYEAPLFKSLKEFLEPLRQQQGPIAQVNVIRKPLTNACLKVGIPMLTHHDLRHWFVTQCIEANVDIPTVSRWVGHKDGGALLMKTYGHLRDEHSQKMAERM